MTKASIVRCGELEESVVACLGTGMSILWIGALALLFYLASISFARGAEPVRSSITLHSQTAVFSPVQAQPHRSWLYRHFHKPTWQEILAQCSTPKEVCRAVNRFVGYRSEDVDRWAPPQETWADGRGDCEDYATLVQRLCRELGIETSVQLFFPRGTGGEGHAVVVGTWNGQMWVSSVGSYEEVESVQDVRERVARVLSCDPDDMWTSKLASTDVDRLIAKGFGRSVAAK
jgi:predicted transglutaminase-like cysteine proteinase